jgi:LacI family transcriptional regulator
MCASVASTWTLARADSANLSGDDPQSHGLHTLESTPKGRRKGQAITIDAVAAHAGVSPMTVSRVVNNQGNVREETRERVLAAVRELGYTPNLAASSLAAAQGTRIALIYDNPSAAYLSELLVGALHSATRHAAQLVIEAWDEHDGPAQQAAARALGGSVAGVILPPPIGESRPVLGELSSAGVPVVAIGPGVFAAHVSRVRIDDFHAAQEIAAHVIAAGHTRIGYIKGHPNQSASARRHEGFQAALKAAGITRSAGLVQQGYFTYRSGLDAAEELLTRRQPPTAIIAGNDDMAAAVVSVAHRHGLEVPRDLSVVGFDDSSAATTVWPELTTVRQPIAAMADAALDILLRNIRRKDGEAPLPTDRVLAHELVQRDSVAPPRA